MANVIGPDVSFYQDDPQTPQGIDFVKMRRAGAGYIIIRAGQNLWGDRDFKANWREAKAAGMPRGSYWFYDSRADPKKQAELWVSQFDGDFGELPLWCDFEDNYGGSFGGWKNWYNFMERLKALLPNKKEIGVYTAYYYWLENMAGVPVASVNYFKQYPLWIANYGTTKPLVPKPWTVDEWTLWQFTDNGDGAVYGVESGNIDLNYFNGDLVALQERFGLMDSPIPDPDPVPTSKRFRVTVPSLKVRNAASLIAPQIGSILLNEIVEEIDANADRTWLNIRKLDDSLTGWSFAAYLQRVSGPVPDPTPDPEPDPTPDPDPIPDPDPVPDEEDTNWYRVTAASLKVRQGPGLTYDSLGLVYLGELVEKIGATADGTWLNVRNTSGTLIGWSASEYLISVHAPVEEEPPVTTPVPEYSDKNWYRVNTVTLNIRETPSTSAKILGTVLKNDTVPALDDSSNPSWIKIQRLDGLTGWCSKAYLVSLGFGRPTSIRQSLFPGITYLCKEITAPRTNVVHVMAIDLQTAKLEFLVTPSPNTSNILCSRVTSKFLEEFKLQVAINGGYYSYVDASVDPVTYCPNGGIPVRVSDYAASRGKIYSPQRTAQPIITLGARNQVNINKIDGAIFNAISGDRVVVDKGVVVKNLAALAPAPRTAIGLSMNARWLTLMVVDGRQAGYSEGITLSELGELLISYGAHTGVNMDGGGSSTMVIKGFDGKARVLNSPIDMAIPGRERAVANHLGLLVRP